MPVVTLAKPELVVEALMKPVLLMRSAPEVLAVAQYAVLDAVNVGEAPAKVEVVVEAVTEAPNSSAIFTIKTKGRFVIAKIFGLEEVEYVLVALIVEVIYPLFETRMPTLSPASQLIPPEGASVTIPDMSVEVEKAV